ncbi:hypothetical protein [Kangiella shandongensis]|uniref:hypothetical protein n=1 Tax=Kangiella shandongensis TaxID=2763258 RepID=UPI001CBEDDE9|nr:hypothetical protein [Kangiella shandongensis]
MQGLSLPPSEKQQVQQFLENISKSESPTIQHTLNSLMAGRESAWMRYLKGAYNHPITWWIGIIQLQMQMGIWGHKWQGVSQTRASLLWQISKPIRNEAFQFIKGNDEPDLIMAIFKYNLKYRKADIMGRLSGGVFTNFASAGGLAGNRIAKKFKSVNRTRKVLNFIIASYGAAIKAIVEGEKTVAPIIQSIITGRAEQLPPNYGRFKSMVLSHEEKIALETVEYSIAEMLSLSQISTGLVPIKEFCTRPENIDLKSICP